MARILVIDDDEMLRHTIRRILQRAGYEVIEAGDGTAGVRLYREQGADLVLTDTFMPGQDGLEVIRALRPEQPRPKVLAMSGGGSLGLLEVLEAAVALGAMGAVRKPFTREELLNAIRNALDKSR